MPKFSAGDVAYLTNLHGVTAMIAVPAMIADLVQQVRTMLQG